jgi:hypothetical protein
MSMIIAGAGEKRMQKVGRPSVYGVAGSSALARDTTGHLPAAGHQLAAEGLMSEFHASCAAYPRT